MRRFCFYIEKISGLMKTLVYVIVLQERSATQMTTLEDLYYGNIIPNEHNFKRGSAYSKLLGYVVRHDDDLKATLTEQRNIRKA